LHHTPQLQTLEQKAVAGSRRPPAAHTVILDSGVLVWLELPKSSASQIAPNQFSRLSLPIQLADSAIRPLPPHFVHGGG
jgi:hypothetical protein